MGIKATCLIEEIETVLFLPPAPPDGSGQALQRESVPEHLDD
jgi:hypothetical protein